MLTEFNWKNGYPKRIAVFRALVVGDMLCIIPALRALKNQWPQSEITLIGLPWAKSFAQRYSHYIDDFLEFPGFPGLPERDVDIHRFPEFIKEAQSRHFDLALQMHGSGSFVNSLLMLLGAEVNAGFYEEDFCPDPRFFMRFPQDTHEIHISLKLMQFLGIHPKGHHLEFPFMHQDLLDWKNTPAIASLEPRRYVCIHPGARLLTRRWPAENFAQVANDLAAQGWEIVLTGGADEADLVAHVSRKIHSPHLNLAGKTTLGALGLLLSRCALLMCNDTGVSHMAAALKVPSIILISGSDPKRWAPLDTSLHHVLMHPVECRPCSYLQCPYDMKCSRQIEPSAVVAYAEKILKANLHETFKYIDMARSRKLSVLFDPVGP